MYEFFKTNSYKDDCNDQSITKCKNFYELQDLNNLEQRLVAPRLPFMQIRLLGFEQQWTVRGNVVNVENDLNTCMKCLPRRFDDASVVQVKLMRRMHYNKPYIHEKISPAKVVKAMRYLLKTPLYVEDGVSWNDEWDSLQNIGRNKNPVLFFKKISCMHEWFLY